MSRASISASSPSSPTSPSSPIAIMVEAYGFRTMRDYLRFKHSQDHLFSSEQDQRKHLEIIELKRFRNLVDVLVRSSFVEQHKEEERRKFFARETHFRSAIEFERSSWNSVIGQLMSEYEERIIESSDSLSSSQQLHLEKRKQQELEEKARRRRRLDSLGGGEEDDDDEKTTPNSKLRVSFQELNIEQLSEEEKNAASPSSSSSASSPLLLSPDSGDSSSGSPTSPFSRAHLSPSAFELPPTFIGRSSSASSLVRLAQLQEQKEQEAKEGKTQQQQQKKKRAGIFSDQKKNAKSNSNEQKTTTTTTKHSSWERPNPFDSMINRDETMFKVPPIVKHRIDKMLKAHGTRLEQDRVERAAADRREQNLVHAKNRSEFVRLSALNQVGAFK